MTFASSLRRLARPLRRFAKDRDGNIAVIFAIVLVPVLSFVGAAIDYTRASNARTAMQAAVDSAALMVSKDLSAGTITAAQVASKAQAYFSALYTNTDASSVTISASYTAKDSNGSSTVVVNGASTIQTAFMRVAGFPTMGLSTGSTATWGGTRMRVAIALDVTGSMNDDGKLAAMQDAAKGLIDTLFGLAKTVDDVYVSIVPFSQMVNVGSANKNAVWINWDDWDEANGSCSSWFYSSKSSCERAGRTWNVNHNSWKGCVTDRDQPNDVTSAVPNSSSTDFPAVLFEQSGSNICPAQILPMTSVFTSKGTDSSTDTSTIKGKINSLVANGGTNQPIGMAWAWQSLRTGDPLNTPAKDANYQYTDTIILLSDGLNTIDRWYGNGRDPSAQVDARQKLLCDNIKTPATAGGKVPQIFTIQVNTDGDAESAVLKYCANPGNFYPTSTTAGIAAAFTAIGTSLSKLRVAR